MPDFQSIDMDSGFFLELIDDGMHFSAVGAFPAVKHD
jgi:hypothetical protein